MRANALVIVNLHAYTLHTYITWLHVTHIGIHTGLTVCTYIHTVRPVPVHTVYIHTYGVPLALLRLQPHPKKPMPPSSDIPW